MLEGGVGYGTFENQFEDGALAGNESTVTSLAVFLGGGVRFTVWEHLSLAPTFGVIYAHTENDFDARNDAGREVVRLAGSSADNLVKGWSADTFTLVPGLELRYRRLFGTVQLTLKLDVQVLPHAADRSVHDRAELREQLPVAVQRGGRRVAAICPSTCGSDSFEPARTSARSTSSADSRPPSEPTTSTRRAAGS